MRVTALGLARTAYVLVAALASATVLPRLGVPGRWVPDLVLIGVVATAVLRGPLHGALVGIAAGWVVELVPPVGRPLGLVPLVMMLGGAAAGTFRSTGARSMVRAFAALVAAGVVVIAGRLAAAVLAEGSTSIGDGLVSLGATVAVGAIALPVLIAVDRALVRRRLG